MRKLLYWFGIILILISAVVWRQWPRAGVTVVVCDVGQGDGILIQDRFSQLLVDTGPPGKSMIACLGKVMPFWDRQIETIVLTHHDSDHSGGLLEINKYYRIHQLITNKLTAEEIRPQLPSTIKIITSSQGDRWQLGHISGEVMWPPKEYHCKDTNNCSLVWRMVYINDSVWFAGDADEQIESKLLAANLIQPTKYLKIGHHGSKTSTTDEFLGILQPRQVWISVGAKNIYGHPNSQTLLRLNRIGASQWRTDTQGTLRHSFKMTHN